MWCKENISRKQVTSDYLLKGLCSWGIKLKWKKKVKIGEKNSKNNHTLEHFLNFSKCSFFSWISSKLCYLLDKIYTRYSNNKTLGFLLKQKQYMSIKIGMWVSSK